MDQVVEAHRYVETWHKASNVVLMIATDQEAQTFTTPRASSIAA
jgi:hypothetical protein